MQALCTILIELLDFNNFSNLIRPQGYINDRPYRIDRPSKNFKFSQLLHIVPRPFDYWFLI